MANHILQTLMYYLLLRTASTFSTRAACGLAQSPQKSFRNLKWVRRKFHLMASNTANTVADSWADISPAHDESKFVPSNAMISHLTSKISWALQTWEGANEIDELERMEIAKNVVDAIIRNKESNASDGDDRQQNKILANYGLTVAKALRVTPGSLHELNKDFMLLEKTITKYQQHLEKNRAVYMNINKHHETMITKSYTTAVSNATSLEVYAEAANQMGKKVWVQEGNMWIEKYSIQFFRGNGARKDYLTANNHDPNLPGQRELAESLPKDIMLEETFTDALSPSSTIEKTKDISKNVLSSSRLIRLVDVGSCYNPIGKSENAAAFTVTALDLCPVDPSVYQCDFLELGIGPRDSTPIFHPSEPDRSPSDAMVEFNDNESNQADMMNGLVKESIVSQRLAQLPAESYDVVSMSLVLNYLPSPTLREDMIKKARQLLIPPGDGGQPHRAGLLLITEKESIFSSDKKVDLEVEVKAEGSSVRGSKSALLDSWVNTIESLGFKLVKYRNVLTPADHRRYHALAFRTVLFSKEPSLVSSSQISSLSEHSSIISSIKNNEINEMKYNNTDNSNDNFMLQKSIDNLKLFKSGIKGMWIKQDFGTSKKNGVNTFNKTHHEFNNTMKVKRGVLGSEEKAGLTGFLGPTVTTIAPSHPTLPSRTSGNSVNPSTLSSVSQNIIPDKGLGSCRPINPLTENNSKNAESSSSSSLVSQDKNAHVLPVAIVGGGLGGCALALSLQRKGIAYVMFEKDTHFTSRKQGYALTLMQVYKSLHSFIHDIVMCCIVLFVLLTV